MVWLPGGQKRSRFCNFPSLSLAEWSERWASFCFFALWLTFGEKAFSVDALEGRSHDQRHSWAYRTLLHSVEVCQSFLRPRVSARTLRRSDRCSRPDWRPGPGRQRNASNHIKSTFRRPNFRTHISGRQSIDSRVDQSIVAIVHASCELTRFSWAGHLKPVRMPRQVLLLSRIAMLQKCKWNQSGWSKE